MAIVKRMMVDLESLYHVWGYKSTVNFAIVERTQSLQSAMCHNVTLNFDKFH